METRDNQYHFQKIRDSQSLDQFLTQNPLESCNRKDISHEKFGIEPGTNWAGTKRIVLVNSAGETPFWNYFVKNTFEIYIFNMLSKFGE